MERIKTHLFVEYPCLVTTHAMTTNKFNRTVRAGCIKAIVIRHHLLPLCICKYLNTTMKISKILGVSSNVLHKLPGFLPAHDSNLTQLPLHLFFPSCQDNYVYHHSSPKKLKRSMKHLEEEMKDRDSCLSKIVII